ncbi:monovalent cation:proton antiporter-2 (CPA2) family protein [Algibacillus agarilyticus]|uniref:monovalent cation:proton antiporter-2 (CPA2) family protein n=1 Tax=Algibacillus agarilyticus TaxID=2234133 RepID=UPI000DCF7E6A|nr:monovalent cation:proton antiporter-2 (CPA2) family protein [Algibacillus agarilyticus]
MDSLSSTLIFLAAAVIAVPIFNKLKLGAILGYLAAGVIIGPSALQLINDPSHILHVAELGVIFLLFIIGLELNPQKLWRMRNSILLTGGGQLVLTASVIAAGLILILDLSTHVALVIALALALSSTAFAIQLMTEQKVLKTPPGQQGFSILLMQDLAVIPILLFVGAISITGGKESVAWWQTLLAIGLVLISGRYIVNPVLRIIARSGSEEVMTAAALLIVTATAVAMDQAGLSMGLGAFVAGILLANSSFRHQLEAEVEPFKGLLLGLFFIAIGMNMDLQLLAINPVVIVGSALGLVAIKALIIFMVLKLRKHNKTDSFRLGLMLSQGGEFAFVVMTQATVGGIIEAELAATVNLVVGISMALTSPLVILHSLGYNSKNVRPVYDTVAHIDEPEIMIAGFGRFAQITARILTANNIPFIALDKDAEHIAFLKQFGNKAFYGDATRLDLLKTAGIEHVNVLFIAVNDEKAFEIATIVRKHYPHIKIVTRVQNRFTVAKFHDIGVTDCVREMFASGLAAAESVLLNHGVDKQRTNEMTQLFKQHDEALLKEAIDHNYDLKTIIQKADQGKQALKSLFQDDKTI